MKGLIRGASSSLVAVRGLMEGKYVSSSSVGV